MSATLSAEEQRIAIAEACGWRRRWNHNRTFVIYNAEGQFEEHEEGTQSGVVHPESLAAMPDYANDLNAMAQAERWLRLKDRSDYWTYGKKLDGLCARYNSDEARTPEETIATFEAPASFRAAAFLAVMEARG